MISSAFGSPSVEAVAINTLGSGFNFPEGVAVDGNGNVFVADSGNNAVKEILAAGGYVTVNTLGSGFLGPNGVAVNGSGNVFAAESINGAVKEILAAGGYVAVNTLSSGFNQPQGVAIDAGGNVFVADTGNNAVKEVIQAGTPVRLQSFAVSPANRIDRESDAIPSRELETSRNTLIDQNTGDC